MDPNKGRPWRGVDVGAGDNAYQFQAFPIRWIQPYPELSDFANLPIESGYAP